MKMRAHMQLKSGKTRYASLIGIEGELKQDLHKGMAKVILKIQEVILI